MSARSEILDRVRSAVADVTTAPGEQGPRPVVEVASPGAVESLELFADNVADYRAEVVRVSPYGVGDAVAQALRDHGARTVVVPSGLDPGWSAACAGACTVVPEGEAGDAGVLDTLDAVVTASVVGIATTGTIVLDHGPDQGRRELSLIPDLHVCVVRADQVVHDVPEAVSRLRPVSGSARPLTWVSGPSATSDIELERVEGVHGPRTLVVVLVEAVTDAIQG